ncbi:A24 family peptidase [Nocardia sp. CC227C]|uniref:A24 family peptidase n=1 Tax=Nocardia sp. CC227C TaxID=3044562 RepID=UPI00278BC47E|nr:A24 family peptidase [Nocardia sp. CC227C]
MDTIPLLGLLLWCAALSAADLRHRRLPNALTLPGAALVLGYAWLDGRWPIALAGALLLALPYALVHLAMPTALGAGDVKLALGLGAACALAGASAWTWAAVGAPLLTALAGTGALLARRPLSRGPHTHEPRPHAHERLGPAGRVVSVGHTGRAGPDRLARRSRPSGTRAGDAAPLAPLAHGAAMCAASVAAIMLTR